MATLATLTVDLVAQSATLRGDLAKANKLTKSWADKTRQHVASAAKAFGAVSVAGLGALTAIYAQASKSGDALAKFSDVIGETPERIIGLQHAAEITGVTTEKFNSSLERMVKRMGEAAGGTGEASKYLEKFNLNNKEFFSLSPAEQFSKISDKVNGLSTQQEKAAAAAALMGREGVALVNTMRLGSAGLAEMQKEAEDLGLTVSRVDLAKMEAANDAFARARGASKSFGNQLAAQVAPIVEAVTNQFVDMAKEAGGFGSVATRVVGAVVKGFGVLADVVHGVRAVWKGLTAAVAQGVAFQLDAIASIDSALRKLLNLIPGVEVAQAGFIQGLAESVRGTADSLAKEFNDFALQPLPSEKIDAWVKDVQAKAQASAEKVAAERKTTIAQSISGIGDESKISGENEKLVSLQQEKFRRLREAALEADGQVKAIEEMRYQRERDEIEKQKQLLIDKGLITQALQEQFYQAEQDAQRVHEDKMLEIKEKGIESEKALAAARTQVFSDLAGVIAAGAEEGSKAQRAALAVQRTLALKESLIALQTAIAKANALGFPASIPAIAEAGLVGYGAINTIKGVAHSGMTNVPSEGTYLLNKGERVIQPSQNDDLKKFLAGNSAQGLNVVVNNYTDSKVSVNQKGQELEVIIKQVSGNISQQIQSGKGLARDLQNTYGLTRRTAS